MKQWLVSVLAPQEILRKLPCLGIPKCSPLVLGIAGVGRFLGFLGSNVRARNSWCLETTAISWEQHKHPPQRLEDGMVDDRTEKKKKKVHCCKWE